MFIRLLGSILLAGTGGGAAVVDAPQVLDVTATVSKPRGDDNEKVAAIIQLRSAKLRHCLNERRLPASTVVRIEYHDIPPMMHIAEATGVIAHGCGPWGWGSHRIPKSRCGVAQPPRLCRCMATSRMSRWRPGRGRPGHTALACYLAAAALSIPAVYNHLASHPEATRDTSHSPSFANCLIADILPTWALDFEVKAVITVRLVQLPPASTMEPATWPCGRDLAACVGPSVFIGPALWTTLTKRGAVKKKPCQTRFGFYGQRYLYVAYCSAEQARGLLKERALQDVLRPFYDGEAGPSGNDDRAWLTGFSPFRVPEDTTVVVQQGGRRLAAVFVNGKLVALDLPTGGVVTVRALGLRASPRRERRRRGWGPTGRGSTQRAVAGGRRARTARRRTPHAFEQVGPCHGVGHAPGPPPAHGHAHAHHH